MTTTSRTAALVAPDNVQPEQPQHATPLQLTIMSVLPPARAAHLQDGLVLGGRVCDDELLPEARLHYQRLREVCRLTISGTAHAQAHDKPVAEVLQAAAGRLAAVLLLLPIPDLHHVAHGQQLAGHGLDIKLLATHVATAVAAGGIRCRAQAL